MLRGQIHLPRPEFMAWVWIPELLEVRRQVLGRMASTELGPCENGAVLKAVVQKPKQMGRHGRQRVRGILGVSRIDKVIYTAITPLAGCGEEAKQQGVVALPSQALGLLVSFLFPFFFF